MTLACQTPFLFNAESTLLNVDATYLAHTLFITVVPISLLTTQGNKNKENHGETNGEASEPMDTSGAAGN